MAMQMQSLLVTPIVGSSFAHHASKLASSFARIGRQSGFPVVKCLAEEQEGDSPSTSKPANPSLSSSPQPTPTPKPLPKVINNKQVQVSTKLGDIFAFSGPAPERINGRLAMIGFVAAVAVELSSGTDLLDQISNGSGGQWFVITSILLSAASLVPLLKGKRAEAKTDGFMNSNAELLNGRFAMLGLLALALTEFVKGGALI